MKSKSADNNFLEFLTSRDSNPLRIPWVLIFITPWLSNLKHILQFNIVGIIDAVFIDIAFLFLLWTFYKNSKEGKIIPSDKRLLFKHVKLVGVVMIFIGLLYSGLILYLSFSVDADDVIPAPSSSTTT